MLFPVATLVLLLCLVHHHWQIISAPVPLDLYEGTMPLITGIIAEGFNPYTREFQPHAADVYPPLYNILVAPLTHIFGNTFLLHRSVSAVFIIIAAGLCGIATQKITRNWRFALATFALMYAALLFYGTPVASTNAPGVAIFIASWMVPWWAKFSHKSLVFALVCGLLSFYTKQYFILGMPILCLYLFLYHSMRAGLILGTVFASLLLSTLFMVHYTSPYYLDNTLFTPSAAAAGLQTWDILLIQLQTFATTYSGLLAIMIVAAIAWLYTKGPGRGLKLLAAHFQLAKVGLNGPLLSAKINFFWFGLFWSTVAIVVSLGQNPGNYMTYLFQLMSPFLLIVAFKTLATVPENLKFISPLVLITLFQSYEILPKDFSTDLDKWGEMRELIAENDEILATQMLVMTLLEENKKVNQDGHTFYFPLAANKPEMFVKNQQQDTVESIWAAYIADMYRKIEHREYDLVLASSWEMRGFFDRNPPANSTLTGRKFLARHYKNVKTIPLSMTDRYGGGTYKVQVWQPRAAKKSRSSQ
ncbi:MAG: hypothetical protein AB8B81_15865 [Halioglobus sp.]